MSNLNDIIHPYFEKFPEQSDLGLARLIFKEHPDRFASVEYCRRAIRYRRGKTGKAKIKGLANKSYVRKGKAKRATQLPASRAKPRKAFQIPQGKTTILSDVHIPYQDDVALEAALDHTDEFQPDNILLNGDTIDFFAISRWEKDPEERNLSGELTDTRQFLMHLRERYPDADIIWKNGNHDERWEKYLWHHAADLIGCEEFELKTVLRFKEYGIRFVHGRQKMKAGRHLTIIHGHEIPGAFDPVNFARTLSMKLKVCAMAGHKHKTSEHSEKTADDKYITCWSIGCLQEQHPDYMPINNWNHGFAQLTLDKSDFEIDNFRIIDGKVYR